LLFFVCFASELLSGMGQDGFGFGVFLFLPVRSSRATGLCELFTIVLAQRHAYLGGTHGGWLKAGTSAVREC
jgi:hypothetical protein